MNKMNAIHEKINKIFKVLEDQKGIEPEIIDLPEENTLADAIIIVQATSRRHAQGLADAIARLCHELKYEILGMEGKNSSGWILIDCNDIIIHIFLEETRSLYRLEDLWTKCARTKETSL